MASSETAPIQDDFVAATADALRHFYDYRYLGRHPLLSWLRELLGDDPAVAVQKLRSLLLDTIEGLRPHPDSPADSLAWRPYEIVHQRYVLGKELAELQAEFGLGDRQIQREQNRAFAEIAARLWARQRDAAETTRPVGDPLVEEIARAAGLRQTFDSLEEVEKAVAAVRPLAQRYGVRLSSVPHARPLPVFGDPALFRQLLVSALSLLIRTSADTVDVCMERQGPRVMCLLVAAGEGAASLQQGKNTASFWLPETLLALAQANGAEVAVHPRPEGPCMRVGVPAAGTESTVVIVEDNQELAALFARYLSRHGYRVLDVSEAATALDRIAAAQADVVVLDVMMGDVDGWQVLHELRTSPRLANIPIAVCSVLDEAELALSLGADEYLKKPVMPGQLQECVARLLRRRHSAAASSSSTAPTGA
ncbi:MAG: response regulator [Anaerolineae bacterium]